MTNYAKLIFFGYVFNPVVPFGVLFVALVIAFVVTFSGPENKVDFTKCAVESVENNVYKLNCENQK